MISKKSSGLKLSILRHLVIAMSAIFFSINSWAAVNTTLSYFGGALQVQVQGPKAVIAGSSAKNQFVVNILDGNGTPYPAITKQWLKASVEMTNMDMGVTPVSKLEDVMDANKQLQGKIALYPIFSMTGPWRLNVAITVSGADGNPMTDTQSVDFDVNK